MLKSLKNFYLLIYNSVKHYFIFLRKSSVFNKLTIFFLCINTAHTGIVSNAVNRQHISRSSRINFM